MRNLAQNLNLDSLQKSVSPNAPDNLSGLVTLLLPYIFYASGAILLIYLTLGGLQWMTSRGDPKAISAAQAKITNAVIGLVIILLSAGLVVLLGTVLHVEVFSKLF